MLQLQTIRENKEEVLKNLAVKNFGRAEEIINKIIEIDAQRRQTQNESDSLKSEANAIAKQVGELMKAGKKDEANAIKAKAAELKEKEKQLSESLSAKEKEMHDLLCLVPNLPNEIVPAGKSAEDNLTVHTWGEMPKLYEGAQAHWDLIKKYDLIDFELGVKITGAGFPVYKGKGAKLQRALINFFLDEAAKAGYHEILPPHMVNADSGFGTGQLPDKEGQMYHVGVDDLYLIPTAEVPITNMYRDVILQESQLPMKNAGYTPCFRREAGSYGAHVRGLNRLHQFDKVEIVQVEHPDKSYDTLDTMVEHVAGLLRSLQLPFRILRLCGGDMSFSSALTYDFEVYSAAQKKWLEVSSVSNFESFQSNRMKLRFRTGSDKPVLAHTLNGSALALPRIVAALLENNQTPDGVIMPDAIRAYTGFDRID